MNSTKGTYVSNAADVILCCILVSNNGKPGGAYPTRNKKALRRLRQPVTLVTSDYKAGDTIRNIGAPITVDGRMSDVWNEGNEIQRQINEAIHAHRKGKGPSVGHFSNVCHKKRGGRRIFILNEAGKKLVNDIVTVAKVKRKLSGNAG